MTVVKYDVTYTVEPSAERRSDLIELGATDQLIRSAQTLLSYESGVTVGSIKILAIGPHRDRV